MDATLRRLLKNFPPEVQTLILKARESIVELAPGAHESIYLGWKTIAYGTTGGMKDQFCAINPLATRINLVFQRGVDLPDPLGLLEGTGKAMRHVKISSPQDLNRRAVKALIEAAAKLSLEA
jgi:hypothetical protein